MKRRSTYGAAYGAAGQAAALGIAAMLCCWPGLRVAAQEAPKPPLQQAPEGRAAAVPQPLNCTGSITGSDGKVETISNCPAPGEAPARNPQVPAAAGKRFPYPGESSPQNSSPAPATPTNSEAVPSAPETNAAGGTGSARRKFPYPGEPGAAPNTSGAAGGSTSRQGGRPASPEASGLDDAGSSGQSSSSAEGAGENSSSSSSGNSGAAAGAPDDPQNPFTQPDSDTVQGGSRKRRKLPPVARLTPSEREEEDVRIAGFYQNDGNFAAAYGRAQDAVALDKDDPEAHLALAEAARKLGKLDEAQKHYHLCLELDPLPKHRKVAERALKDMSGGV